MGPINMRLYRRFDADLIALLECGIPVNLIAEILLEKYAIGERVKIIPDGCHMFDIRTKKCIHLTVNVKSKEAARLISQIRFGYRNQFCKSLLRDALMLNPVWVYFTEDGYVQMEENAIKTAGGTDNVVVLPGNLRRKDYRTLLNGGKLPKRRRRKAQQEEELVAVHIKKDDAKPVMDASALEDVEGWSLRRAKRFDDAEADVPSGNETEKTEEIKEKTESSGADEDISSNAFFEKEENTGQYKEPVSTKEEKESEEDDLQDFMDSFDSLF